ncbi:MAG: hypothetical protein JKX83_04130 [Pseudomonadales bacterium]|nr:hypothetical protein [Pseudomonadales bacterium]
MSITITTDLYESLPKLSAPPPKPKTNKIKSIDTRILQDYIPRDILSEQFFIDAETDYPLNQITDIYAKYHLAYEDENLNIDKLTFHPDVINFYFLFDKSNPRVLESLILKSMKPPTSDMWLDVFCTRYAHRLVCTNVEQGQFMYFTDKYIWKPYSMSKVKNLIYNFENRMDEIPDVVKIFTDKYGYFSNITDHNGEKQKQWVTGKSIRTQQIHSKQDKIGRRLCVENWDEYAKANKYFLKTPDYVVDLNTFEQLIPLPAHFRITGGMAVNPEDHPEDEIRIRNILFNCVKDMNIVDKILETLSLALVFGNEGKCYIVLYGPHGNEGKTMWQRVIYALFGDLAYTLSTGDVSKTRDTSGADVGLYHMKGKQVVILPELGDDVLDEQMRLLSSKDQFNVRNNYDTEMTQMQFGAMVITASNVYQSSDITVKANAIRKLVVFMQTQFMLKDKYQQRLEDFNNNKDVVQLGESDMEEQLLEMLPAFLYMLIKYRKAYSERGCVIKTPLVMEQFANRMAMESDNVWAFCEMYLVKLDDSVWEMYRSPTAVVRLHELYVKYANKMFNKSDICNFPKFLKKLEYFKIPVDKDYDILTSHKLNYPRAKANLNNGNHLARAFIHRKGCLESPVDMGKPIPAIIPQTRVDACRVQYQLRCEDEGQRLFREYPKLEGESKDAKDQRKVPWSFMKDLQLELYKEFGYKKYSMSNIMMFLKESEPNAPKEYTNTIFDNHNEVDMKEFCDNPDLHDGSIPQGSYTHTSSSEHGSTFVECLKCDNSYSKKESSVYSVCTICKYRHIDEHSYNLSNFSASFDVLVEELEKQKQCQDCKLWRKFDKDFPDDEFCSKCDKKRALEEDNPEEFDNGDDSSYSMDFSRDEKVSIKETNSCFLIQGVDGEEILTCIKCQDSIEKEKNKLFVRCNYCSFINADRAVYSEELINMNEKDIYDFLFSQGKCYDINCDKWGLPAGNDRFSCPDHTTMW